MKIFSFILLLIASLFIAVSAYSLDITLTWDANSEPDLSHYIVYWGITRGDYTSNSGNIGLVTEYSVEIPDDGLIYYFAVTAVDDAGLESDFSNEVVYKEEEDDELKDDEGSENNLAEEGAASNGDCVDYDNDNYSEEDGILDDTDTHGDGIVDGQDDYTLYDDYTVSVISVNCFGIATVILLLLLSGRIMIYRNRFSVSCPKMIKSQK